MSTSNPLLRFIVLVLLVVTVAIVLWPSSKLPETSPEKTAALNETLTVEELEALGLVGDTPKDTVATLVGQVKAMRDDVEKVKQENQRLQDENSKLRDDRASIDQTVKNAIEDAKLNNAEKTGHLTSALDALQGQLNQLTNTARGTYDDIPVGLGLEGNGLAGAPSGSTDELVWHKPLDVIPVDPSGNRTPTSSFPSSFSSLSSSLSSLDDNPISQSQKGLRANLKGERDLEEADPRFTIPENSTLMGSVAMTAMIGRVPIQGSVTDPYPFKVLIGTDNLISNGIELPDVESAVVSGTATGDWTLSCVSGAINSITFTFQDGRVRTVPAPQAVASGQSNNSQRSNIGWISDPYGVPCISGTRKTNASQFIASQFFMGGLAAAGEAYANRETTTSADSSGSSTAVTGNLGSYILGKAGAGGMEDVRKWAMERYGQTFDAVYVPPGQQVAIHITSEIPIDYELNGRKVKYESGQTALLELD
ncbi:TIGR03752 family integrating conjugative element protein [Pseudomonas aeruginosa]|uniref:TIGR03752 family integrating conjugative element protein n=1 Tax=Pseudomonas aeruginosa TaxID=287 RepID=UPI00106769C0|nr:TIGR03752 family integrating conjugative element protein [Pseudomonas aeruginosa]TEP46261.1 TIGR03752 family integrating conjugative element protein [Pseudomonas aeruginosa]TEP55338.1 TIGR03752 family integrating conjugative element protein [Pseudomonas aeruginosa]